MKERDWLTGTDPDSMLRYVSSKLNDRRLRLFLCKCCRRVWEHIDDPRLRNAIVVSERYAEGKADEADMDQVRIEVNTLLRQMGRYAQLYRNLGLTGERHVL